MSQLTDTRLTRSLLLATWTKPGVRCFPKQLLLQQTRLANRAAGKAWPQAATTAGSAARLQVAAGRPGASLNDLLDDQLRDPLSGNAVLSGIAVQMSAV